MIKKFQTKTKKMFVFFPFLFIILNIILRRELYKLRIKSKSIRLHVLWISAVNLLLLLYCEQRHTFLANHSQKCCIIFSSGEFRHHCKNWMFSSSSYFLMSLQYGLAHNLAEKWMVYFPLLFIFVKQFKQECFYTL